MFGPAARSSPSARATIFGRLDSIDGGLDLGVEFLHAETGAVEVKCPDLPNHRVRKGALIALDRNFGAGQQVKAHGETRHNGGKVLGLENRRRTAAECKCETGIRSGSAPANRLGEINTLN